MALRACSHGHSTTSLLGGNLKQFFRSSAEQIKDPFYVLSSLSPQQLTLIVLSDRRDRTRAASPLEAAADAVVIDSSSLTEDEVLARVEELVAERLGH
jgi:hypothetical protein